MRLGPDELDAVVAAIDGALSDAADLTIDELDAEVIKRAGGWAGERVMPAFQDLWPRSRQAVSAAAYRGVLCFGPNRGRRTTYATRGAGSARARRRAAFPRTTRHASSSGATSMPTGRRDPSTSPAGSARRRRGRRTRFGWPATSWSGSTSRATSCGSSPGTTWLRSSVARSGSCPTSTRTPLAATPGSGSSPGRAFERALARTQAGNLPVLVVDGSVIGIWHQRRSGSRVALTVEPFRKLTTAERRSLEAQVERIGAIQEAAATLTIGTVTAGPHA